MAKRWRGKMDEKGNIEIGPDDGLDFKTVVAVVFGILILVFVVAPIFSTFFACISIPQAIVDLLPKTSESLTELDIIQTHSPVIDSIETYDSVEDCYGNEYKAPYFDLCSYGPSDGNDAVQAYTELATEGQWRYLEGTFFCRPNQADDFSIAFQVYADGQLVYDSGQITKATAPIDFKVDIQNAQVIRVASYSNDYTLFGTNPGIILVNATVRK